jgi:hypothetical protein
MLRMQCDVEEIKVRKLDTRLYVEKLRGYDVYEVRGSDVM